MEHPRADILRAIADGHTIQDSTNYGSYIDIPTHTALRILSGGGRYLRVKPYDAELKRAVDTTVTRDKYRLSIEFKSKEALQNFVAKL
jgi:hypothetical protein